MGPDPHPVAQQRLQQDQARRLAQVVGTRLEGQPPERHRAPLPASLEQLAEGLEEQLLLPRVARFHRAQYLAVVALLLGAADQRADVLGKARAAVAAAGVDEMGADALVATHAAAHVLDVDAGEGAQPGHLVHEGNLGGEEGIGRVLAELGLATPHQQDPLVIAQERRVELAQGFPGLRLGAADDDPVRAPEVVHRRAFLEELRIARHRHPEALAPARQAQADDLFDPFGGAHRHGRLVDHDAGLAQLRAKLLGDRHHVAEVGRAVLAARRADGDEHHLGVGQAFRQAGGEGQAGGVQLIAQDAFQARFVDRHLAASQPRDPLAVTLHATHLVAHLGETGRRHQSHIARTNHA